VEPGVVWDVEPSEQQLKDEGRRDASFAGEETRRQLRWLLSKFCMGR
jgi:hypothetical protein